MAHATSACIVARVGVQQKPNLGRQASAPTGLALTQGDTTTCIGCDLTGRSRYLESISTFDSFAKFGEKAVFLVGPCDGGKTSLFFRLRDGLKNGSLRGTHTSMITSEATFSVVDDSKLNLSLECPFISKYFALSQ